MKWCKTGAYLKEKKFGNRYCVNVSSFYNCTEFWKQSEVLGEKETRQKGGHHS